MAKSYPKRAMRAVHPGEFLRTITIPAMNKSIAEVAVMLGVSRQTLNQIVNEKQSVTAAMALRLGKLFGTSPESWLNMQTAFDLQRARAELTEPLEAVRRYEMPG